MLGNLMKLKDIMQYETPIMLLRIQWPVISHKIKPLNAIGTIARYIAAVLPHKGNVTSRVVSDGKYRSNIGYNTNAMLVIEVKSVIIKIKNENVPKK
jgi:hypothetical protein